ncbi:hypothetical protein DL93DRAFT_2061473 [Clavulina sp. PMI_390]|nr:hypothetical protein DL93DRAFT_2061473 [Clavulina sp. PMI_390]
MRSLFSNAGHLTKRVWRPAPRPRFPAVIVRHNSSNPKETSLYYVSTPIFYVNAVPHIGHLYTSVIADIATRFHQLRHDIKDPSGTFLNTGTDEHGLKIQRAAEAARKDPKLFCDQISRRFSDLASAADVKYDRFMRTTDEDHIRAAQHFWTQLVESGAVYKGEHSGWYSVSDECFYTDSQIEPSPGQEAEAKGQMRSIETGSIVEWTKEENYKFRLGLYREQLLRWVEEHPDFLHPPSRRAELLEYLSSPDSTPDLSISRPRKRLQWGIPVPGDEEHTIYVWLEALVNYLTAVGYPRSQPHVVETEMEKNGWPTNLHIVGKDITRFHAVLFPAFLMAAKLPLPHTVLAHGHWTVDRFKMSKSRGNVVDPFEEMQTYGTDSVRFFLMRNGGNFSSDSNWSDTELRKVYDHDLRNTIGNLLARLTGPKIGQSLAHATDYLEWHSQHGPKDVLGLPAQSEFIPVRASPDGQLKASLTTLRDDVGALMGRYEYGKAIERIMSDSTLVNPHGVDAEQHPTLLSDIAKLRRTHLYLHESLRISGILLQPFMPTKSAELLDALGVSIEERGWQDAVLGGKSWATASQSRVSAPKDLGTPPTVQEDAPLTLESQAKHYSARPDRKTVVLFSNLER